MCASPAMIGPEVCLGPSERGKVDRIPRPYPMRPALLDLFGSSDSAVRMALHDDLMFRVFIVQMPAEICLE